MFPGFFGGRLANVGSEGDVVRVDDHAHVGAGVVLVGPVQGVDQGHADITRGDPFLCWGVSTYNMKCNFSTKLWKITSNFT